ncbi:hypothetical protein roselon_01168 [Roseibacterium elongatum DSM 19469]|uniref:Uncharacterized protein n=1 Tax=Roseicyclus elongatus DSM 19469 TaxID=1294273 RepID=W8RQW8_9RHOB|nr:hypothetical protein roselon_01168 [Roseibacterium elongatum DSM 19469]
MYDDRNIIEAELFKAEAEPRRTTSKRVDKSVLIARNLMFWSSAAFSCGAVYLVLTAIT